MADPAPGHSNVHSPAFILLTVIVGLAAAWGWMHFAQPMADTIETSSILILALLFYFLVYGPLILLALGLGSLSGLPVARAQGGELRSAALAMAAGAGAALLCAGIAALNRGFASGSNGQKFQATLFALGVGLTLFQIIAEELLFRGWLRRALEATIGERAGLIVGSLAYAAFILASGGFALFPFFNLSLLALFFGLVAQRLGILAAIAAHYGWGAMEGLVLGIDPNPGTGPFGALWDHDLTGLPIWGGSDAGLMGSIGTSAVLLALILPLWSRPATSEPFPQPA